VVELILVERKEEGLSVSSHSSCCLQSLQVSTAAALERIDFFKKEGQRLLSGSSFVFKSSLFCSLNLAIALQSF
jgi:hypothetical protein